MTKFGQATLYRAEILSEGANRGYHSHADFFEFAAWLVDVGRYGAAAEALSVAKRH